MQKLVLSFDDNLKLDDAGIKGATEKLIADLGDPDKPIVSLPQGVTVQVFDASIAHKEFTRQQKEKEKTEEEKQKAEEAATKAAEKAEREAAREAQKEATSHARHTGK